MTGCPYNALAIADDAAILAADDNCPPKSPVCLLNKKCVLLNADCKTLLSTLTKDLTGMTLPLVSFYPFAAVGNLANYPNATLGVDCAGGYLDLSTLLFPAKFTTTRLNRPTIALHRCKLRSLSAEIKWPTNLETLSLIDNQLSALPPNLPQGLRTLRLSSNHIQDISKLRTVPLTYLDLRANALTSIQDMTWPALNYLELGGNSALQTIKHVQLTNAIEYVGATATALTDWIMDETTYLALRRLTPTASNTSTLDTASISGVVRSSTFCDAIENAALKPLWSVDASSTWKVCVMGSPNGKAPPTTNNTTWVITAAVIALIALLGVLYKRWRRRAWTEPSDGLATELDAFEPIRIPSRDL
ncbi:hypothetical protein SDRG_14726, partial [Saprolegnia diclina VS20]